MGWITAKWWFDHITRNVNWNDILWDLKYYVIPDAIRWFVNLFN